MTIKELKARKKELGLSNALIAKLSGVPLGTVQKIFGGATASPRYETLRALEQVLAPPPATAANRGRYNVSLAGTSRVCETLAPYLPATKKQGEFTLKDYYTLPDEQRAELIDGVLYDMASPTSAHQLIAGYIHAMLLNHITANQGQCLPMISPLDVQLDSDNRTMVQPDVLIVCNRRQVINRCVYGAPDFAVEILSPSTKRKDMIIKLNKYMNAGVREYWIIDPDKKSIIVYDFEHEEYPIIYTFDAEIPVAVLDGKCRIDFRTLREQISFLDEQSDPTL